MRSLRVLSPDRPTFAGQSEWYECSTAGHFWIEWRFAEAQRMLRLTGLRREEPLRCLDVGGGTGTFGSEIEARSSWSVDVVDLNRAALERAEPLRGEALLYDVQERRVEFHSRYEVVFLMDVLEHVREPVRMLEAVLWHLKPKGYLLVNVPALMSLFGAYDRAVGHRRRYSRTVLAGEVSEAGGEVVGARYWGFLLVPVLAARTLLQRGKLERGEAIRRGMMPRNVWVDRLLRALMKSELAWRGRVPIGTSVLLLGRRPEN